MSDSNGYSPEGRPQADRPKRGGFADPEVRAKAAATRAAKAAKQGSATTASMRELATEKADRQAEAAANKLTRAAREAEAKTAEQARADGIRRADGTLRRKRPNMDGMRDSRLQQALTADMDHEIYVYRWANDEIGRIDHLYDEDWDRVDGQKPVPSGASRTRPGEPRMKVLMRKRKDDFLEDTRARNARVNAALEQVRNDPLGAGGLRNAAYEASRESGLAGETGQFYVREGWQNGYEQGI